MARVRLVEYVKEDQCLAGSEELNQDGAVVLNEEVDGPEGEEVTVVTFKRIRRKRIGGKGYVFQANPSYGGRFVEEVEDEKAVRFFLSQGEEMFKIASDLEAGIEKELFVAVFENTTVLSDYVTPLIEEALEEAAEVAKKKFASLEGKLAALKKTASKED